MRCMRYVCLMITFLVVCPSPVFAESKVKEGIVVEYAVDTDVSSSESGRYTIEIRNSNAYDVEVLLNVYSMVTGKAFGAVLCNADYLKTLQIEAGGSLKLVEQNCQATRRGKYEYDVNIMNVKKIETPPEPVSQETGLPPAPAEIEEEEPQPAPPGPQKPPEPVTQEKPQPEQAEAQQPEEMPLQEEDQVIPPKDSTVEAIQQHLARLGYDPGGIDGLMGGKTAAAIKEFQAAVNMPVDGIPSEHVLNLLAETPVATPETPQPNPTPTPMETPISAAQFPETKPKSAPTPAPEDTPAAEATPPELSEPEEELASAPGIQEEPAGMPAFQEEDAGPQRDPLVEEIQTFLRQTGYNPGPVDGKMGRNTEAAIRQFQQDQGIAVDGRPSAELAQLLADERARSLRPAAQRPSEQESRLGIGMLFDGRKRDDVVDLLKQELRQLFDNEYDVSMPEEHILTGDWTRAGIARNLDQLLTNPAIDVIVAFDFIASHEASHRKHLSKPVIAPLVLDPELQNLPQKGEGSGVRNLNYLISVPTLTDGVAAFQSLASFDKMAIFINQRNVEAMPELRGRLRIGEVEMLQGDNLSVKPVLVGESVDEALTQVPPDIRAVYLTPLLHLSADEMQRLITELNARDLLTFSHLGRDDVEKGVLAAIAPESDLQRLARRVAINIQRIVMGDDAGTFSVHFRKEGGEQLVINMDTARAIGFEPSFVTLLDAELLHEEPEGIARELSLRDVVNEALDANLEILTKRQDVAAGEENTAIANAKRLPQIEISALTKMIDDDRASALGGQAERDLSGAVSLTQVLFSDQANANVAIQQHVQRIEEDELEQLRLDIALEAATAYLNVLRAKTYEAIQKANLQVTKSNLELAKVRQSIGTSGPGEVYRWESELATAQRDFLDVKNDRKQAEMNVNRLLHRPQEEAFLTNEVAIDDPRLMMAAALFETYLNTPQLFTLFRDFSVQKGLAGAPELAQIDAAIAAQKRLITSLSREYTLPTIALTGETRYYLAKGGEGSEGMDTSGFPPDMADSFGDSPDDLDWMVGIQVSLPIFSGGGTRAELRQAKLELEALLLQREVVAEKLEQQIRSAVFQTGNSHAKIQFAKNAAQAARSTLDLVTDAYRRGAASILDLIDAQNVALVADQLVADSLYNFLIDVVKSERAINQFHRFMFEEERAGFLEEFEAYLNGQGVSIPATP